VDTGEGTQTGGRLKRVMPYVGDETFCFTYGDGLADLDLAGVVDFHRERGRLATVTAVQPPGRFGALELDGDRATAFEEKPRGERVLERHRRQPADLLVEAACVGDDEGRLARALRERAEAQELRAAGELGELGHQVAHRDGPAGRDVDRALGIAVEQRAEGLGHLGHVEEVTHLFAAGRGRLLAALERAEYRGNEAARVLARAEQ